MVRKSLWYPIAVLTIAGLGLLLLPNPTLWLLGNSTPFEPMVIRLMGMFVLGLASFVLLTYYYKLEQLYIWTIYIRLFFLLTLVILFSVYRNLLFGFMLLLLMVGIGWTIIAYQFDENT